uniref:Uncharacterized protein n=1 Tax=Chrysotila carterae TaxID=13221 RepID=A0A7S4BT62_CHRCT
MSKRNPRLTDNGQVATEVLGLSVAKLLEGHERTEINGADVCLTLEQDPADPEMAILYQVHNDGSMTPRDHPNVRIKAARQSRAAGAYDALMQLVQDNLNEYTSMLDDFRKELHLDISKSDFEAKGLRKNLEDMSVAMQELRNDLDDLSRSKTADVVVIGMEGSGKSSTVNRIIRTAARKLSASRGPPEVSSSLNLTGSNDDFCGKILFAEKELCDKIKAETRKIFHGRKGDIVPTGYGAGSMSAHQTTFHLSREADHGSLKLAMKYCAKQELMDVLAFAKDTVARPEGSEPTSPVPADWSLRLCRACAILGLDVGAYAMDPEPVLREYQATGGKFELPRSCDERLLGHERIFVIKHGSRDQQLEELADLLLLHTMDWSKVLKSRCEMKWRALSGGRHSLWALVESVEVIVPSETELRVVDAPGFNHNSDPFRQSIALAAVHSSAATLLMCFNHNRDTNGDVLKRVGTGVLTDFLNAKGLYRELGCLASVSALDWEAKDDLLNADEDGTTRQVIDELKSTREARKRNDRKQVKQALLGEAGANDAKNEARVNAAMKDAYQCHVVDVRGVFSNTKYTAFMDKQLLAQISMEKFVKELERNAQASREKQLMKRLSALLSGGLLPFYSLTRTIKKLTDFKLPEDAMYDDPERLFPPLKELEKIATETLVGADGSTGPFSDASINSAIKELRTQVLDPITEQCSSEKLKDAWRRPHILCDGRAHGYATPRSQALGKDLRTLKPERTLLPVLVVGPLATKGDVAMQTWLQERAPKLRQPIEMLTCIKASSELTSINASSERSKKDKSSSIKTISLIDLFTSKIEHISNRGDDELATCLRTLADVLRYEVGQARALLDAGFGKRWNTLRRKVALNFRTEMNAALRKRCIAQLQSASSPPAAPCALRERSS